VHGPYVLAERALSCLLEQSWPRMLEKLESG
jgi:hypothetical protein